MITLAPGDGLYVVPSGAAVYATAMGELIPVGGGAPQPQILGAVTAAVSTWNLLYSPPAGYQALVNHVYLTNPNTTDSKCAVNVIPSGGGTPGAQVGGPGAVLVSASNGAAIFSRDGWHTYTNAGTPWEHIRAVPRVEKPSDTTVSGANPISGWTLGWPGGFATTSAGGIMIQRTGIWMLSGSFRVGGTANTGLRFGSFNVGGGIGWPISTADYMAGGATVAAGAGWTLTGIGQIAAGNLATLGLWSDTAGSNWNATTYLSAMYLGPSG